MVGQLFVDHGFRHAENGAALRVLRNHASPALFQPAAAFRAIATHARHHHGQGPISEHVGRGTKQVVD